MDKIRIARFTMAALGALCGAHAVAQPDIAPDVLATLPPPEQMAYVKAKVASQQARLSATAGVLDTTGPVLTKFTASTKLDLRQAQPTFKVAVKGTDDLSGLNYLYFYALGPSGQYLYGYYYAGFPQTAFSGNAGLSTPVSRLTEPGTYNIVSAYAYDVAGNYSYVDAPTLASLGGNTVFTVVNSAGYDIVKPTLVGGKILTPTISVASHAAGTTDKDPYIGITVDTTDAGNTAVSGVRQATAVFCKSGDTGTCIYVSGSTYAGGQPTLTLNLSGTVTPTTALGNYLLYYLYVSDFASNYAYYYSTDFAGTTDFSTMFPTTKIKVTP